MAVENELLVPVRRRRRRRGARRSYFGAGLILELCSARPAVIPREGGVTSTPRPLDSITVASGILDHPPQCAIAHKAGDDGRLPKNSAICEPAHKVRDL